MDRAQTEADRIDRFQQFSGRLQAVTAEQVQELVRRYLGATAAVEVLVLPEGVEIP